MKKHPLIRSLYYDKFSAVLDRYSEDDRFSIETLKEKNITQVNRRNIILGVTDDNSCTASFVYNDSGKAVYIPLPDMSLVYLRLAYVNLKDINDFRRDLLNANRELHGGLESVYRYVGSASVGVINIFTSLESFCNQIIPQEIKYPKGKRILNYSEVVYETTKEKIKNVLPFCYRKSFRTFDSKSYDYIADMEEVRNSIVHLKFQGKVDDQVVLFEKLLNIDCSRLYRAVVSFFNFYRKDYVVECNCSQDF